MSDSNTLTKKQIALRAILSTLPILAVAFMYSSLEDPPIAALEYLIAVVGFANLMCWWVVALWNDPNGSSSIKSHVDMPPPPTIKAVHLCGVITMILGSAYLLLIEEMHFKDFHYCLFLFGTVLGWLALYFLTAATRKRWDIANPFSLYDHANDQTDFALPWPTTFQFVVTCFIAELLVATYYGVDDHVDLIAFTRTFGAMALIFLNIGVLNKSANSQWRLAHKDPTTTLLPRAPDSKINT